MNWIEVDDVILTHSRIIQASGMDGLHDCAGLEAAAIPLSSYGGHSAEVEKIARLWYGLAASHAFVDSNKRTKAMLVQLLLKWNGYHFRTKAQ